MTQLFHRRHILKTLASIPLIDPLLPVYNSVTEATLIDNGKSYSLKLGLPSDEPILSYTESMMEFGIPRAIKYKALTDKGYSHFDALRVVQPYARHVKFPVEYTLEAKIKEQDNYCNPTVSLCRTYTWCHLAHNDKHLEHLMKRLVNNFRPHIKTLFCVMGWDDPYSEEKLGPLEIPKFKLDNYDFQLKSVTWSHARLNRKIP